MKSNTHQQKYSTSHQEDTYDKRKGGISNNNISTLYECTDKIGSFLIQHFKEDKDSLS